MMDIKTRVKCSVSGREWDETYKNVDTQDPIQHAKDVVADWNSSLRPHEKAREFISAVVVNDEVTIAHQWYKVNLVTLMRPRPHDIHKCENCKVTGKTFRLGDSVMRDNKYKADKYIFCSSLNVPQQTEKDLK